jgi:hypothetical protein
MCPSDPTLGTGVFLGVWTGGDQVEGAFTTLRLDECDILLESF